MIWLNSASQRAYNYAHRPKFTADERVAIELVIGYVHPSNLGPLPPSPAVLLGKARQIGLL